MLALDPRMVRALQLKSSTKPSEQQGLRGDPRRASAELGQVGVDAVLKKTIDAIKKATARR